MTLYFDIGSFANDADRELLKRVPQRVATYYLALPLAGEDGRVTVVTAHPDNLAGLTVLERLLDAEVVPVSSSESALQEAIARVYEEDVPSEEAILAWTDDPRWHDTVMATAHAFGQALGQDVHHLNCATPLDALIPAAGCAGISLLVTHVSDPGALSRLVHESPTSLLLVRGEYTALDSLLVALRGYGSDHQALDRVLPMLARQNTAATVMPLARSASARLSELMAADLPARQHLQTILHELDQNDVPVSVQLRPGDPMTQIMAELGQGSYDLLVLAAEADGEFVWRVLSQIESEAVFPGRPLLIIRPPVGAVVSIPS